MSVKVMVVRPDWLIVGLLWFAFFLNQADRQIYNVVLPLIQTDLGLSNEAMGSVAAIFTLAYGLLVPFSGLVGDAWNRRWVIVASLLIFSVGTATTAMASSFMLLVLCRGVATGVGEAFYSPAATALIGETHVRTRARALAVHQTANYTGIVLGSFVTGWVAQRFGWRSSFLLYGAVGIIWALVIVIVSRRNPSVPRPPVRLATQMLQLADAVRYVSRSPRLLAQFAAFAGLVFGMVGFLTWTPTLLHERFGLSIADAGFSSVFYHHLMAYVSLLATSALTDRLIVRYPRARLLAMAAGLILSGPAILLASQASSLLYVYVGFALYGFFRGAYDAGLFAAILDEVDDERRATVIGLLISSAFVIGAASPLIMGALKTDYGLETGLMVIAAVQVVAGGILLTTTLLYRQRV